MVKPYLDDTPRGVFATRAPARPNPIGLSAVRLLEVRGNLLRVRDVDILNGTPLLDIKPYFPQFDCFKVARSGWLKGSTLGRAKADNRFEKKKGNRRPWSRPRSSSRLGQQILKTPGLKTGSLERGFGEAYIATQPEIEMGTSYDEQIASGRLRRRVFFILWQPRRMQE